MESPGILRPGPPQGPPTSARPVSHPPGRVTRGVLSVLAVVLFSAVAALIFHPKVELSPDARSGFIGAILGYVAGYASNVYAFFFPQNDE